MRAIIMTGASNWVVITYELPHKLRGCVGKCLGEASVEAAPTPARRRRIVMDEGDY